jgi:hypothetical protein
MYGAILLRPYTYSWSAQEQLYNNFIPETKIRLAALSTWNFTPYWSNVELNSTAVSAVPGQTSSSNRHIILRFMLVFS